MSHISANHFNRLCVDKYMSICVYLFRSNRGYSLCLWNLVSVKILPVVNKTINSTTQRLFSRLRSALNRPVRQPGRQTLTVASLPTDSSAHRFRPRLPSFFSPLLIHNLYLSLSPKVENINLKFCPKFCKFLNNLFFYN